MQSNSSKARLMEVLDQLENFSLCDPSDMPDTRAAVVRDFRRLLHAFKRAARIVSDQETRSEIEGLGIPDDIFGVYDSHAAACALIPEIRDELTADSTIVTEPDVLRTFISYSTADKLVAGQVKLFFAGYKIEAFLAHEDISVSQEWKDRIIEELKQATIVVAILSSSFKKSEWTSQEIGFAFARGTTFFIPLSIDGTTPYGFISHIQGKPVPKSRSIHDLLIDPLITRFPRRVIPLAIEQLAGASSFRGAEALMLPLVPHFDKFNDTEINSFMKAAVENGQIWDAGLCRAEYLPAFLQRFRTRIDNQLLESLEAKWKRK